MVLLSLEIAGVVHFGDGEVINVICHPRELSRQSGRVPLVLSVLVILSVAILVWLILRLG